ncbi:OLC1v1022125C2 [Oldenlandia corymbosa var. corymbosa]|uniref:Probable purine permease n=1 Tax=Oldenlandia corymbosa var. corymbosa TaxID=529605 RepID=A0AAV1BZS8_OLDCO|nr:OLC1v1022125C2 [Oldenlandia corymbosa var. corymbosa]
MCFCASQNSFSDFTMEKAQEHALDIKGYHKEDLHLNVPSIKQYMWWLQVGIYIVFVLSGQAIGVLLGRLYFDKGGNSEWMATLVQNIGFPVLLPLLLSSPSKTNTSKSDNDKQPSVLVLASIYVFLGLLLAAECMLHSIGLKYLPVSTYSLICASQLAFVALFSFFLNSQKLTPFILNSLVLLTISSIILVMQTDAEETNKTSKKKFAVGVICTIAGSALCAFMLSITQLIFQKVVKQETFKVILDLSIYESLVATLVITVGLFVSGEWKSLKSEMEEFKLGKASYVMTLIWTAISWQIFEIGCNGLIFKVSSLFSNSIGVVGLPVPPVLAVIFFHDKITGAKVVSLFLAFWGFSSYVYQHYLDDLKSKNEVGASSSEVDEDNNEVK